MRSARRDDVRLIFGRGLPCLEVNAAPATAKTHKQPVRMDKRMLNQDHYALEGIDLLEDNPSQATAGLRVCLQEV